MTTNSKVNIFLAVALISASTNFFIESVILAVISIISGSAVIYYLLFYKEKR